MENAPKYTEDQIALINEHLEEEQEVLKESLQKIFEPSLPTPLKSAEMLSAEQNAKIESFIAFLQEDTKLAIEFYLAECLPDNRPRLEEILKKVLSVVNTYAGTEGFTPITDEDSEFLEELAKARLVREAYSEASCMYRFLVQISPMFSGGWVGWAICEEEQNHMEVVDYIYQLACEFLPFDYYICLFAADFYTSIGQKDKAKILLEKAKNQLEADHMENSKSFEEIQLSLRNLE